MTDQGRRTPWLAKQMAVSRATAWRWRRGYYVPDETKLKIARLLGVSVEELFFSDDLAASPNQSQLTG